MRQFVCQVNKSEMPSPNDSFISNPEDELQPAAGDFFIPGVEATISARWVTDESVVKNGVAGWVVRERARIASIRPGRKVSIYDGTGVTNGVVRAFRPQLGDKIPYTMILRGSRHESRVAPYQITLLEGEPMKQIEAA